MERQKEKQHTAALVFWDHACFLTSSFWERQEFCSAYRLQGLITYGIKYKTEILREAAWKSDLQPAQRENNPLYLENTVYTTSNSEL